MQQILHTRTWIQIIEPLIYPGKMVLEATCKMFPLAHHRSYLSRLDSDMFHSCFVISMKSYYVSFNNFDIKNDTFGNFQGA
jgi:hypothetical protein